MADEKRYAFIPLSFENRERALGGEIVVDELTGDVWIKNRQTGELISATSNLDARVRELLGSGTNSSSYAFNNNRRIYRFYFENDIVRLDRALELPKEVAYFRIRDLRDDAKYYVPELTNINSDAVTIFPFENNEVYFVEFYNIKREMVSMMSFSAKYAPVVLQDGEPDKIISRLEIHTNKDFLYVTEDPSSLLIRVYAIYEDGSSKDVTNYDSLVMNSEITTDEAHTHVLKATWFYDQTFGQFVEAEKEISVIVDEYAAVTDLIIVPRKVIRLNDGSRYIKLNIVAYFEDGTSKTVSDEVTVSNNFDPTLFNVPQYLTIKFNAGHLNVIEKDYTLLVNDDGSASENILFYRDSLMSIAGDFVLPADAQFYKVRDAEDLNFYFTIGFNNVGYDAAFMEKPNILDKVRTGMNLIVEFYNDDKELLDSTVFTAKYREDV
jgi:hypothetical protein